MTENKNLNYLKDFAEKIKEEKDFSSLAIIGTKSTQLTHYKLGSPHEMLMSLLSTYGDVWKEMDVEENIKSGDIEDKN